MHIICIAVLKTCICVFFSALQSCLDQNESLFYTVRMENDMKKQIISLIMCFTCFLSTGISSYADEKENLFINGDFEQLLSTGGWGSRHSADYERITENPQSGEYCIKVLVDMATETWIHDLRLTPGETYDFSMWAKTDKGVGEVDVTGYFNYGYAYEAYNNPDMQVTQFKSKAGENWTQITHTFTYTGLNADGEKVDDNIQFGIRLGRYKEKIYVYMDNFTLTPRGYADSESPRMPKTYKWDEDPLPKAKDTESKNFTDTVNHWAKSTIDALSADKIVNGISETEFAPNANVTRAEFLTFLINSLGVKRDEIKKTYSDVDKKSWYAKTFTAAEEIGLIPSEMIVGDKIYPEQSLKRGEASALLVKYAAALGQKPETDAKNFSDSSGFGIYASYINDASALGLINGYEDNTFRSNGTITRAEATEMVKNAIELKRRRFIYVDPVSGSDENTGTLPNPLKTISKAQEIVRANNENMIGNIYVFLKAGTHIMTETLELNQNDSGTNGFSIIYTSYGDGKALLSGAEKKVYSWELYDKEKGIYKTYVGNVASRNMYVNGIRAIRAKSDVRLTNYSYSPGAEWEIATKSTWVADLTNNGDIELVHNGSYYCNFRPFVEDIKLDGDIVRMKLYNDFTDTNRTDNMYMASNLWIENAYELLDRAGEWYWNKENGNLYYKPRAWEDLDTAEITLPSKEILINGNGVINDDTYSPLHSISFKNIDFAYTGLYNSYNERKGMAFFQNGILRRATQKDLSDEIHYTPNAGVMLNNVAYIDIEDCDFKKMGSIGLKIEGAAQHININANHFYDLSGSSMQIGALDTKNDDDYYPTDKRYYKADINITNNYIHDTAVETLSAGALAITNLQYSKVMHNEIFRTSYSGMHIGYGFSARAFNLFYDTPITYNYIHDTNSVRYNLRDGGAIYFMGTTYGDLRDALTQEGRNKVSYNYVADLGTTVNSIYSDEGASWLEISHNVFDTKKKWWTYGVLTTGNQSKYNIVKDNYISADTIQVSDRLISPFTEWYEETGGVIQDNQGQRLEMGGQIGKHTLLEGDIGNWDEGALEIVKNAGISTEYIDKFPEEFQNVKVIGQDYGWIDNNPLDEQFLPAVFDMNSGDTISIPVVGENRKRTKGYISADRIYIENQNPDIVEIMPDNSVKALKKGKADLTVEVLCGENKDVVFTYPVEIYVDDAVAFRSDVQRWHFWHNGSMGIFKPQIGIPYDFDLSFTTELGRKIAPLEVEFSSDAPQFAEFDEEGRLVAKEPGEGNVVIKMTWGGLRKTEEFTVPFTAIDNEMYTDFSEDQIIDIDENFLDINNWTFAGTNRIQTQSPGEIKLNSDMIMIYNKERFENKLLHFKMTVNHGGGWPSIALNCSDSYSHLNNEYIITFYENSLEWQRYNNGKRSILWGQGNMFDGTVEIYGGRPGIKFEYGKEYDVGIGAFDVEQGVRVVVYLDGLKVFDGIDYINNQQYNVVNAPVLSGGGYFGVHSTESNNANVTLSIPDPKK